MSDPTQIKADIVPYTSEYAREVRSWIDSEETYYNLCQGKGFPPPENLLETWQRPDVSSYLLLTRNQPVAYGEIWYQQQKISAEIKHLLVSPVMRSKGYGASMLRLLFNRVSQRTGLVKVMINVPHENAELLGCGLKAGFELSPTSAGSGDLRMIRVVTK